MNSDPKQNQMQKWNLHFQNYEELDCAHSSAIRVHLIKQYLCSTIPHLGRLVQYMMGEICKTLTVQAQAQCQ